MGRRPQPSHVGPARGRVQSWPNARCGRAVHLELDGGIDPETASKVIEARAVVVGSSTFGRPDNAAAIARLRPTVPC
jgi:pentose-5-phosphate-3-epimerase